VPDFSVWLAPEGEAAFTSKTTPVIATYSAADITFISDLVLYTEAWNATQLDGRSQIPLNRLNIFLKACFPAATAAGFDISTLTVSNFGGTVGDLLGTLAPNVGNLIISAGMSACGLDMATLNNPIVAA
jgi:hypothetical protein